MLVCASNMIRLKLTEKLRGANITAYRLAQLTNIHEAQISKMKNGKVKGISFDTLERLCKAFNCKPGDLLVLQADNPKHLSAKERATSKPKARKEASRKVQ